MSWQLYHFQNNSTKFTSGTTYSKAHFLEIMHTSQCWNHLRSENISCICNFHTLKIFRIYMSSSEVYIKIIHHLLFSKTVPLSRKSINSPFHFRGRSIIWFLTFLRMRVWSNDTHKNRKGSTGLVTL
jgi:hypothetical protein